MVADPAASPPSPPRGRYGRGGEDARADRTLKIVGAVLGTALLVMVSWFGYSYVAGTDVSGGMVKFQVVSDEAVEVHLEVRKEADVSGVCTLRALAVGGGEVGRKDVRIGGGESRVDTIATVRTTARASAAELVVCQAAETR